MRYLLDSGILLRLPHRDDPAHRIVRGSVRSLRHQGSTLVTATQNVAKFWNVCTRPHEARGGLGLNTAETLRRLRLLERHIRVLGEPKSAYLKWKSLVIAHGVGGRQVHDARLVALMYAYRIRRLLTLNAADFARYPNIDVIMPQSIVNES